MCAMSMRFKSIVYITQPVECATFCPDFSREMPSFACLSACFAFCLGLLGCGFLYHKMWQMWWCVAACWLVLCRFLSVRLIFYDFCFSIFFRFNGKTSSDILIPLSVVCVS